MKTFLSPLTPEQEMECLKKMKDGDLEAKKELTLRNMRLVAHVAKKYQNSDEDMEDLISIGTIGLIKAISTYKEDYGSRLATYAARCIDNAILSQMRLWFQVNSLRAEKNRDGVFWHRYPRICISFALLWTAV